MVKRVHMPLIFDASTESGARLDTRGSTATFYHSPALSVPGDAQNVEFTLIRAYAWHSAHNVLPSQNDRIVVDGDDYILPPGLYSLQAMSDALDRLLTEGGLPAGTVTLSGDVATQRVLVVIASSGHQVTFPADGPYQLLGMTSGQSVPSGGNTTGAYVEMAPSVADFGSVSRFYIHSDILAGKGIPISGAPSEILGEISLAQTQPNSLAEERPNIPIPLDASALVGQTISRTTWWLTTDGTRRPTTAENWGATVLISYEIDD